MHVERAYVFLTFLIHIHVCVDLNSDDSYVPEDGFYPVLIDCILSWKYRIENIAVKISRSYGIIAKLKYFVPPGTYTLLRNYKI